MPRELFQKFDRRDVTDDMLIDASTLFNENYGVWGKFPGDSQGVPQPGSRVKMSKSRLRAQCLPNGVDCSYIKVTVEDRLAGNAFACRWKFNGKTVCWITQLVVHSEYRERRLASRLLMSIQEEEDEIFGIMSSHPAACMAAAKAFGNGIDYVTTGFIRDNAAGIMKESPVDYVRNAQPRGSLFEPGDASGAVSSVCTNFFVDHDEPLRALKRVREFRNWPLGELLDGDEFLVMIETRDRRRPRSHTE